MTKDAPAPFTTDTPSACRAAWTGGVGLPPQWRYYLGIDAVDTAGFHALVRAAGLPEAELLHMGFTAQELRGDTGSYVWRERAVQLLGRIAWDSEYGDGECRAWNSTRAKDPGGLPACLIVDRRAVTRLGTAVVEAWFAL